MSDMDDEDIDIDDDLEPTGPGMQAAMHHHHHPNLHVGGPMGSVGGPLPRTTLPPRPPGAPLIAALAKTKADITNRIPRDITPGDDEDEDDDRRLVINHPAVTPDESVSPASGMTTSNSPTSSSVSHPSSGVPSPRGHNGHLPLTGATTGQQDTVDENSSGVHDVHSGDSGGEARGHSPDSDPSADPDQEDGIDDVEVDSGREDST